MTDRLIVGISAWLLTRTKMSVIVGARYKHVTITRMWPLYTPEHVRVKGPCPTPYVTGPRTPLGQKIARK